MTKNFILLLSFIFLLGCHKKTVPTSPSTPNDVIVNKEETKPEINQSPIKWVDFPTAIPKREFRGAWIATVTNIDWPSNKNLTVEQQKAEFDEIISRLQIIGLNGVFVQVRTASDALYSRSIEQWSEWLTGTQGQAPSPYYDPMYYMIEASHNRNIEFHAWLNINRGTHPSAKSISNDHITKTKPEWFYSYDKHLLYNFGIPEVREYIIDIFKNIAKNYDVDGIHIDDYFYPYTVKGERIDDQKTFAKYGAGFKSIEDWRRNNIDLLVAGINSAIKSEKPYVKFGVSPFSVWRNKADDPSGSNTKAGQTSFDNLFADTKSWPAKGMIDYMVPQVYFTFESKAVPYKEICEWWTKQMAGRNLYIGHATYKVDPKSDDAAWRNPEQIPAQIMYDRANPSISGDVFYNTKSLLVNKLNLAENINKLYSYPALLPLMPWIPSEVPPGIKGFQVKKVKNLGNILTWQLPELNSENIYKFVIYRFNVNEEYNIGDPKNLFKILPNNGINSFVDDTVENGKQYVYLISTMNRLSVESQEKKTFKI